MNADQVNPDSGEIKPEFAGLNIVKKCITYPPNDIPPIQIR